jgi:hypothetical protein
MLALASDKGGDCMLQILLGLGALLGVFFLGNAERHDMKSPAPVYWFTWIFGGVAGVVYVGTQIGGPAGFMVGLVLAGAYIAAVGWSLGRPVSSNSEASAPPEADKLEKTPPNPPSAG